MKRLFNKKGKLVGLAILLFSVLVCISIPSAQVNEALTKEIESLKKEVDADPNNVDKLMKLGQRYGWASMQQEAIQVYERVIALEPNNVKALQSLKDFYMWTSQNGKAVTTLEKLLQLDPENTEYRFELAKNYGWSGQNKKAIPLLEELLKKDPENADFKERLAYSYMWDGQTDKAMATFQDILAKDPNNIKARKGLADLYRYTSKQDEAINIYKQIVDVIQTTQEKGEIFRRMGDAYTSTKSYAKARDYYEQVLRIDPSNVEARQRLDQIEFLMRPQVYAKFDYYQAQGAERRFIETYGLTQQLDDDYKMDMRYLHDKRTEDGEDRLVTQGLEVDVSKYFGDGLILFGGTGLYYYGMSETPRLGYFVRADKTFDPKVRGILTYRMRPEDSSWYTLLQNVDRHYVSGTIFYDWIDRVSFNTTLEGHYLTKGNTSSDNLGLHLYFSPIFHIVKGNPLLDLSYTYFRANYLKKDPNAYDVFEYYNPTQAQSHSFTWYYSQDVTDRLTVIGSNTMSVLLDKQEYSNEGLGDTIYAEVRYKLTKYLILSGSYLEFFQLTKDGDDYDDVKEVIIKVSHVF